MLFYDPIGIKETSLGIPYSRPEGDPTSHSYVDLRRYPELIGQLPELRNSQPLRDLIEAINSPGSIFETYGCERWSQPWSDPRLPDFNMRFGSYVDLAFVDKEQCRAPEVYHHLIKTFQQDAEKGDRLPDTMHAGFELVSTSSFSDSSWWTLSVWLYGIGRNEKEAEHWWKELLRIFQSFIELSPNSQFVPIPN